MSLIDDIQPWVDKKTGLILAADYGRDNIPVSTATLLTLLGILERVDFVKAFNQYEIQSSLEPGLMLREPGNPDRSSVDNVICNAICGKLLGLGTEKRIYQYGKEHFYSYNVKEPGKFSLKDCYLRFIGFPPFMKLLAKGEIGFFGRCCYRLSLTFSLFGKTKDVGNKCLQYLMNKAIFGKSLALDQAILRWQEKMMKKYPGGMRDVFTYYYGASHPFSEYGRKDFK